MKLTNYIRDAFVRSVMNDVPRVDYDEQAHKLLRDAIAEHFDKKYGAGKYKALVESGWLHNQWTHMPNSIADCYVHVPNHIDLKKEFPDVWAQIDDLAAKAGAQNEIRGQLERSIHAAAYSVTTRKALAELLPEFEKYLPADDAKAIKINLPAVANIVADFTRAGWPKQKEAA